MQETSNTPRNKIKFLTIKDGQPEHIQSGGQKCLRKQQQDFGGNNIVIHFEEAWPLSAMPNRHAHTLTSSALPCFAPTHSPPLCSMSALP